MRKLVPGVGVDHGAGVLVRLAHLDGRGQEGWGRPAVVG